MNDTGKALFILHWGNIHREILLNTPQIAHVSSQDPTHISVVTQHTTECCKRSHYFPLWDMPAQRCRRDQNDHIVVSNNIALDPLFACWMLLAKALFFYRRRKNYTSLVVTVCYVALCAKAFFIHHGKAHSLTCRMPFWWRNNPRGTGRTASRFFEAWMLFLRE